MDTGICQCVYMLHYVAMLFSWMSRCPAPTAGRSPTMGQKQPIITPSTPWLILQKFSVEIHSVVCNQAWPNVLLSEGATLTVSTTQGGSTTEGERKVWKGSRIARHSLWATVRVFVFLIWVWFVVESESEGKYWILPLHPSTCLINPMSHCHSPSP